MGQLGAQGEISIFLVLGQDMQWHFPHKIHSQKSRTHVSGIEPVTKNYLPFWIQFVVCKIHHISKDGLEMVQLGN